MQEQWAQQNLKQIFKISKSSLIFEVAHFRIDPFSKGPVFEVARFLKWPIMEVTHFRSDLFSRWPLFKVPYFPKWPVFQVNHSWSALLTKWSVFRRGFRNDPFSISPIFKVTHFKSDSFPKWYGLDEINFFMWSFEVTLFRNGRFPSGLISELTLFTNDHNFIFN